MSNSDIEQAGTVKGHIPNEASLSGRISNGLSLSGHISIGSVAGDFVIKMMVEFEGSELIVTSCDTTVEQIDEAVAAEKRVVLVASVDGTILELPMVQGNKGNSYYFCAILSESVFLSTVYKIENTSDWSFGTIHIGDITAEDVSYPNSLGEGAPENVGQALDVLLTGFNATREDILRLNKSEHTHSNKSVLDKFAETDGKPTYNGEALGSGSGDFIIKMTVEGHDEGYFTVTSCDTTIEQIDAAVAAEKRVVVIATDTTSGRFWELPIVEAYQGATYIFIAYTYGRRMMATVYKSGENEIWEFSEGGISAESIDYFNSTQPDVESVHAALNKLFDKSHAHANKDTLDKLSVSNGKLQYNGSDVGLKGDKGDTPVKGTDYWTAADKQEIVADTLAALPKWTGGNY